MATVVLLRHGRTTANATGVLAGRTSGVHLDETGRQQATRAADRLAHVPLAALVTSPLVRCRETATAVAAAQTQALKVGQEHGLIECDYGEWQGRALKELAKEKLWGMVQQQPSAAGFPGGETMRAMQSRAVDAIRRHDASVEAERGAGAVWVAVSHGDLIKAILADALGMHLDLFQRIQVDPASISIIRFTPGRPFVLATNTHEGDLKWLAAPTHGKSRSRRTPTPDAAVGGGSGPDIGHGK
jgi:probable phosphomutase (TIGR03848 family)